MVASPHALATVAGVDVLRRGGNAVNVAIATQRRAGRLVI